MKISKSSMVLTAAFAGLLGGTMNRVNAAPVNGNSGIRCRRFGAARSVGRFRRRRGQACLQGQELLQGQGRLQDRRQRLQGQELLQGQGRLRHRRFQEEEALSQRTLPRGRVLDPAPNSSPSICPPIRFNGYTDYGIGIGLRIPHYQHIFEHKPVVDWFEIISENYMVDGGRPLAVLDQILEQYRVVQHGVSMYFGSAEPLNREHLRRLKALVQAHQDALAHRSSLLGQRRRTLHARSAAHALHLRSGRSHGAQDPRGARFPRSPIAVENVSSYAEFHVSEMTEWEFLNEVVERADCGILLDVNKSTSRRRITISIRTNT